MIMRGVAQTRRLARGLFPVENDPEGLQSALRELAVHSTQLLEVQCSFECDTPAPIFDNVCATHLYHIAQESVSNASRHGKARSILIRLSASPQEVALSVTDDGIGLPAARPGGQGMGLSIMQYRSRIIGGNFEASPRSGGGTIVRCTFPSSR
jgi:signal transduction histidine kinase